MPGDWIKVRTELPRDPRVARIARECQSNAAHVVGSLVIIWTSISETSRDGLLPEGVGDSDLDHMGLLPGLSKSMRSVGWLETDEPSGLLRLPDFTRYIGSAKERANARERQRDSRAGRPPPERDKTPLSQNVTVTSRDGPVTKRDCHTENENETEIVSRENRVRAREAAPKLPTKPGDAEAVVWAAFDPVLAGMYPNGWRPDKFIARLNDLGTRLIPQTPADRLEGLLVALAAWLPTTKCDSPQGAIGLLGNEWARCLDSGQEPGVRTALAPIAVAASQIAKPDQSANIAAMEAAVNGRKR